MDFFEEKDAAEQIIQSLQSIWLDFLERLPFLGAGLIVFLLTLVISAIASRVVQRVLRDSRLNPSLCNLIRQMTQVVIVVTGILITTVVIFPGMTPAKILGAMGIASVAIGFAFKDIVENFFAGILILWRFPFDLGDYIRCGDIEGEVENITIRMTLLRKPDDELVILPNSKLFKEAVFVLTDKDVCRIEIICGVAYGENVSESREVIKKAVEGCDTVNHAHEVQVFANEFASSSINFEVAWWADPTPLGVRRSRDEVIDAIKTSLDEAGIEIPFPYRTLTFKDPVALEMEKKDG